MSQMVKAVQIESFGGPEVMQLIDVAARGCLSQSAAVSDGHGSLWRR